MIIHNPILTGSFTVNGTDVASITSSAASLTSLNAATASLNSFSASVLTFTASAATTGSNTFVGNQVVSGSLTVTGSITTPGTLTAQTLVVQTITSSVDFVTGSTRFGSLDVNTHQFTGSVLITGSITTTSTGSFARGIIGTRTNPAANYPFEVYGNDARVVVQDNSNNTAGFFMRVVSGSTQVGSATIRTDNTGTFTIFAGGLSESARLIINSNGSIGIGITPASTWGSSTKVVQIGSGSLYNDGFNNILIANNSYFNGSNNIHIATGPALRYYQELSNGDHYFQVAPSKVSGSAVSYTSSLYIKNNGNIGVNTESPLVKLHVVGGSEVGMRVIVAGTYSPIQFSGDNNVTSGSINAYAGIIAIGRTTSTGTGVNPDININSSGNVGIGVQNSSYRLHISGSASGNPLVVEGGTGGWVIFKRAGKTLYLNANYSDLNQYAQVSPLSSDNMGLSLSSRETVSDLFITGSTGYVGINTITPSYNLHVNGTGYFSSGVRYGNGSTTLNYYEQGTIDITTLTDGSATLSQFSGNQTLSYTRIGNRVFVNGNIYNQSISGTWSNPLRIPLPFTAASGDGRNRSYGAAALYNWGSASDNVYLIEAGATYASLVSAGSGGAWGTITTSSGFTAVVNFSYIAS